MPTPRKTPRSSRSSRPTGSPRTAEAPQPPKPELELAVRQHERFACSLDTSLVIAPEDQQRVRFSPGVLARALGGTAVNRGGGVVCRVVDCSPGGLGLRSPVFLPRKCRVIIRTTDGFVAKVRVRRIVMADRQPTYYVGCSFEDRTEEFDRQVAELLQRARTALRGHEGEPDARV